MKIVEIDAFKNGAHNNQVIDCAIPVPDGWAVIPDTMETPNFPFGTITTAEIDGVMTVTSWTAGTIPEPEPGPEPETTLDERVSSLETTKADQTDVDELNEALNMILTDYTGEGGRG